MAIGVTLGVLAQLIGVDEMSSGQALYAAAYAAVESAVDLLGELN